MRPRPASRSSIPQYHEPPPGCRRPPDDAADPLLRGSGAAQALPRALRRRFFLERGEALRPLSPEGRDRAGLRRGSRALESRGVAGGEKERSLLEGRFDLLEGSRMTGWPSITIRP